MEVVVEDNKHILVKSKRSGAVVFKLSSEMKNKVQSCMHNHTRDYPGLIQACRETTPAHTTIEASLANHHVPRAYKRDPPSAAQYALA